MTQQEEGAPGQGQEHDGRPQPMTEPGEVMVEVEQPFIGKVRMYGSPLKMSETPCCVRGHGPLLGEHTREVLGDVLKYGKEQIDSLYAGGILFQEPAVEMLEKK